MKQFGLNNNLQQSWVMFNHIARRLCFLFFKTTGILLCLFLLSTKSNALHSIDKNTPQLSNSNIQINKIKSAYLYNFLKYIELHQDQSEPQQKEFLVCVLGDDPFGKALDDLNGRIAKGLKVKVKRFSNVSQARLCHIVFISQTEQANLYDILSVLSLASILTVSDIPDFTKQGGIIAFTRENEKIGIEINLTNARKAKIRISALLLEIAKLTE